jgi:hypothetical protein
METKGTETVDLTPTREGYIVMLRTIIEGSTNKDDVEWAERELAKLSGTLSLLPRTTWVSEEEF